MHPCGRLKILFFARLGPIGEKSELSGGLITQKMFVSFFFKGTTWMQEIVWQLYHNGEISSKKVGHRVPLVERLTDAQGFDVRTIPSPRLMHTHLPYDVIPKGESEDTKCKYIYIARNPKDVAVSFYKFEADLAPITGYNGPWDFFIKLFLEKKGKLSQMKHL